MIFLWFIWEGTPPESGWQSQMGLGLQYGEKPWPREPYKMCVTHHLCSKRFNTGLYWRETPPHVCELSARHQTLYSAALIVHYVHLGQHWMQHCSCSLSSCPSGPLSLSVSEKVVPSVSSMSTQFSTIGLINPHGDDGFEGKQTSSNSNQPTAVKNRVRERRSWNCVE